MPETDTIPETDTPDCVFGTILGFILPFFLAAANGNRTTARATIVALINAYHASTATELDLVGRIIGFSLAAMDNLRLSMVPSLSDTRVLRYRCNAVTLSRASDQARAILEAMQGGLTQTRATPRPSVIVPPAAPILAAAKDVPAPPTDQQPAQSPAPARLLGLQPTTLSGGFKSQPMDIEAMKRDARIMMGAFSKDGARRQRVDAGASQLRHHRQCRRRCCSRRLPPRTGDVMPATYY